MRILIITTLYPDDSPIKVTNAIHDLVRFWTDSHEVICFKEDWIYVSNFFRKVKASEQLKSLVGHKYCERDGVKIYRFSSIANPFACFDIQLLRSLFAKIMAHKMNKKLERLQYHPDLVISHVPVPYFVDYIDNLQINCPRIAVMHISDVRQLDYDMKHGSYFNKKIALINQQFDAIYARSHSIYKRLAEMGRLEKLREDIISSGVPQSEEYCEKKWEDWENRNKTILYVGSLIQRKGADVLLKSLSQIKDDYQFRCIIVGEGEEHDKLQGLCKDLDMEDVVRMVNNVPRREVYDYMKRADVFAMPSRNETLGLVYLEAMANGCITIGSKNEGIDGIIVDGENGFLVNALDVDDLTKCIKNIFDLPEKQLQNVSRNAKITADQYTQEERAQIYLEKVMEQSDMYKTEEI